MRDHTALEDPGGARRIVWVSGFPSHYMRELHRRLQQLPGWSTEFFYVRNRGVQARSGHEHGEMADRVVVFEDDLRGRIGLWRALERQRPQFLVISGHFPIGLVVAWLWGRMRRTKIAYWADTNILDQMERRSIAAGLGRMAVGFLLRRVDVLLYIGARTRDYYAWMCGQDRLRDRLVRMPYPHLVERFDLENAPEERERDRFVILYFGRLAPEKGVDRLLRAYARLEGRDRSAALLRVAGHGPERETLEALAVELGISDRVEFLGLVRSGLAPPVFADSDVVVVPSRREPWGLVVNEALSSAKPVVAPFWVGAVPDLVIDGVTGVVLENNEPETIARALRRLIKDRAWCRQMGENGRRHVRAGGWTVDGAVACFGELMAGMRERHRA